MPPAKQPSPRQRRLPKIFAAIGITNQRETTVVWERKTGKAIHKAIVWQDRRTAEICAELKAQGHEELFRERTGLLLDPYFSGTKVSWILDHVKGARERAERGELCFGTIDSFLIWRLTGGKAHVTDATNASRTLLYNIHNGAWDGELLNILRVPRAMLPEVKDCAADFGKTEAKLLGAAIPILGVAGDQQAATIGQACFEPGMMKSTYGTGCFALLNTGNKAVVSNNRLLTTVAYQLDGKRTYALEGAIFIAGAAVQWLRDGLKVVKNAADTGALAKLADKNQSVYLVPAFVGLGAPYWNADIRGALFGLTRATTNKELARAALEAVCYQTNDLLEAMKKDWGTTGETILRVDGGMTASDWTMQFLADILGRTGGSPSGAGDDCAWGRLSRGPAGGTSAETRGFREHLETAETVHPKDGYRYPRTEAGGMGRSGKEAVGLASRKRPSSGLLTVWIQGRGQFSLFWQFLPRRPQQLFLIW